MRIAFFAVFVALLPFCSLQAQDPAPPVVEGTVEAHDGTALSTAHVHIRPFGIERLRSIPVENGTFQASLDTTGIVGLRFTGRNHEPQNAIIVARPGDTIGVDVRLGTFPKPDPFELEVLGGFNDFSPRTGTIPMKRRDDGTFVATVPSPEDSLTYGIVGSRADGTQSDRLTYAGHGNYRPIVASPGDSTTVTFDPSAIPRSDVEPTVAFRDSSSASAEYAVFVDSLEARREAFINAMKNAASQKERKAVSDSFDWSPNHERLEAALETDRPTSVQNAYRAAYLAETREVDSTLAKEALSVIPASSPLWGYEGRSLAAGAIRAAGGLDAHKEFAYKVLRENPGNDVKAGLLLGLLVEADKRDAEERQELLYSWLEAEYSDTHYIRIARSRFSPDRAVQAGKPAPDFEVARLRDSTKTYTTSTFEGKYVLLDFWATWCGPCIQELPTLRKAYSKYEDDGFAILSLSFDRDRSTVTDFLKDHEMPWKHAFLDEGFESDVADAYEVVGIPKPVLVGPEGRVVETASDLRGEELLETLSEHVGDGTTGDGDD